MQADGLERRLHRLAAQEARPEREVFAHAQRRLYRILVAEIVRLLADRAVAAALQNEAVALDRVGGDRELLKELMEVYRTECPRWLADIRGAISCGDAAGLCRAAHSLKGASSIFGAAEAVSAAQRRHRLSAPPSAIVSWTN